MHMMLDSLSVFRESRHPQIYMHFLSPNPAPRFLNNLKANTDHMLENALIYCFLRVKGDFHVQYEEFFQWGKPLISKARQKQSILFAFSVDSQLETLTLNDTNIVIQSVNMFLFKRGVARNCNV